MRSNIFDKFSFLSLFLVIVLLPFFFLSFTNIPVETSKGLLYVNSLNNYASMPVSVGPLPVTYPASKK